MIDKKTFSAVLLIYHSEEKFEIFKIETNDKEGIDKIAVHNEMKPK